MLNKIKHKLIKLISIKKTITSSSVGDQSIAVWISFGIKALVSKSKM